MLYGFHRGNTQVEFFQGLVFLLCATVRYHFTVTVQYPFKNQFCQGINRVAEVNILVQENIPLIKIDRKVKEIEQQHEIDGLIPNG